ncbi:MAG TPA: hypothetical protein VF666_15850 [Pyrinomonadaceae bacterium]|jgi:chromosome segregation ATPase
MDETFLTTLDETTKRYVREALKDFDTDNELREQLAGVQRQAAEVAQEVEAGASPSDALAFTREFDRFLNRTKAKALEAKRIETEIERKRAEVADAQTEIQQRTALMPALSQAVNQALSRYEEVRHEYNVQEFNIATLESRISLRRAELAALRRKLALLKEQETTNED